MRQLITLKDNERNMSQANRDRQSFEEVMVKVFKDEGWKIEIKWKRVEKWERGPTDRRKKRLNR